MKAMSQRFLVFLTCSLALTDAQEAVYRQPASLMFNGSDYEMVDQGTGATNMGFSAMVWLYATQRPLALARVFGKGNVSATTFGLYMSAQGVALSGYDDAAGDASEAEGPMVELENWTHLAMVYDADAQAQQLYVNGELVANVSGNAPSTSNQPMTLGAAPSANHIEDASGFVGVLTDARFYAYAASPQDIMAIYEDRCVQNDPVERTSEQAFSGPGEEQCQGGSLSAVAMGVSWCGHAPAVGVWNELDLLAPMRVSAVTLMNGVNDTMNSSMISGSITEFNLSYSMDGEEFTDYNETFFSDFSEYAENDIQIDAPFNARYVRLVVAAFTGYPSGAWAVKACPEASPPGKEYPYCAIAKRSIQQKFRDLGIRTQSCNSGST